MEASLDNLHVRSNHEAVRQWVQRFGSSMEGYFETDEAEIAVIDETKVKIGKGSVSLRLKAERTFD